MSTSSDRAELIEARVIREEEFALEAWRARVSFPEMRRAALDVLGYPLSESALHGLVKSARARHGDLTMTREERQERQAEEIDERGARARYDLGKAHAAMQEPRPRREDFDEAVDYASALVAWAKMQEGAAKVLESADRRLAAAMKDERDLFGLNAPTKIEADVTTRDAVSAELDEMMRRLDAEALS